MKYLFFSSASSCSLCLCSISHLQTLSYPSVTHFLFFTLTHQFFHSLSFIHPLIFLKLSRDKKLHGYYIAMELTSLICYFNEFICSIYLRFYYSFYCSQHPIYLNIIWYNYIGYTYFFTKLHLVVEVHEFISISVLTSNLNYFQDQRSHFLHRNNDHANGKQFK